MLRVPRVAALGVVLVAVLTTGRTSTAVAGVQPPGSGPPRRAQAVRVWEEHVVIATYPLRPEDPNPHFRELGGSIIYPYTMQDGFSSELVEREYRAVFLENEYLRVMCLPEIGGRIHSVFDKLRGEEMFHVNRVIKPGHIALRGAWVSGGIEWNRGPQGHTVTSFSPVDVVGASHADGSASLVIGNTEMNFRTAWTVRLTLHPGRAYLDERIELFNPTDGVHPYYFWNNTAFPQRDGTRFIYPMSLGSDHDGANFFSWPSHEGRDLTWLKNYPGPTSVFGYRVPFDFFGAYDVDRDFGLVQVADHRVLPGKKAWTWGQSDAGMVAQAALTDDDGPYIEVQSGPLPTQADFAMLTPGQRVAWREHWYPVGGLGDGFEYATPDVVVQRLEAGDPKWNSSGGGQSRVDGVELRFVSTARFEGARLVVDRGDERLVDRVLDLEPGDVEVVPLEVPPGARLDVAVTSRTGRELLRYASPLAIPDRRPPAAPPPGEGASVEELYLDGFEADKRGDREAARSAYESALERDPGYTDALAGLAVLEGEAGRYERARQLLDAVLARRPDQGMARYLRGVASLRLGELDAASDDGAAATMLEGAAALGYGLIGRTQMLRGNAAAALDAFAAGLRAGGADQIRLQELHLLAAYAAGDLGAAGDRARRQIAAGSVRLVPRAVVALAEASDANGSARDDDDRLAAARRRFAADVGAWLGEPEFAVLELAFGFADLGLWREAAGLAAAALIDELAPGRPLPLYSRAYFEERAGDVVASRRWLDAAGAIVADHVFASRPEMIPVLQYAVAQRAEDARAWLYLGNLYAGLGRLREAAASWRRAADLDPLSSVAQRNLGLLAWYRTGNLGEAADRLARAIAARPADQTLARDLARVHLARRDPEAAVGVLGAAAGRSDRRPDVVVLLARSYRDLGRYDEAIDLLASTRFTNREGVRDTWELFSDAHIRRGVERFERAATVGGVGAEASDLFAAALSDFETALTYPRNLNAGRPDRPQEARASYWRGMALEAIGDLDGARRSWRRCADQPPGGPAQNEHIGLCRGKLR